MATFTTIKFGDGLGVTDEGSGVIRVDSGSGAPAVTAPRLLAQLFGPMPGSLSASGMYRIPYLAGAAVTYTLSRVSLHLETAGSTTTTLLLEKSTASGSFVASTVATLTLAASATDVTVTSSLGSLVSGTLIRWRWTALGTGAANFQAQVEGSS